MALWHKNIYRAKLSGFHQYKSDIMSKNISLGGHEVRLYFSKL